MANEEINILQYNESQLNTLRTLAEAKTGRSSTFAQNILCFGYQECAVENQAPEERKKSSRVYSMDKTTVLPLADGRSVKIQPNPANDLIQLQLEKFELYKINLKLRIYSVDGRLVVEKSIHENNTNINLSKLNNGTYLYNLYDGEQNIHQGKFIVKH